MCTRSCTLRVIGCRELWFQLMLHTHIYIRILTGLDEYIIVIIAILHCQGRSGKYINRNESN